MGWVVQWREATVVKSCYFHSIKVIYLPVRESAHFHFTRVSQVSAKEL